MSSDENQQKEFGQLGDIVKDVTGDDIDTSNLPESATESVAKFENLSDQDKEDIAKGALGKVESSEKQ